MTNKTYITGLGTYLPNEPVNNEEMEEYLGRIADKPSVARQRILNQNGIKQRYYAIDKQQQSTHSNAEMAAKALESALEKSSVDTKSIELLATGTTQADLPIPGFASMVHGHSSLDACELASFQSVCASGMMALRDADLQIRSGEKKAAAVVGSEFASRLFKASRYEAQGVSQLSFDTEFLRWMLSDGAGAFVLQPEKNPRSYSLEIEWIDIKSHAHQQDLCMYAGQNNNQDNTKSWLDYDSYESASQAEAINLKQDIRQLDQVVKTGVAHYFDLIDQGKINAEEVDCLCCHYSSEFFKKPIQELMKKGGGMIPEDRWFTNLCTKGNTGAASIFIMLEELTYSGSLKNGQKILCMVPESGRFITSFMMLTVHAPESASLLKDYPVRKIEAPELVVEKNPTSEWLVRQLSQIWIEFETKLLQVPVVKKIHSGKLTLEDYKLLIRDLRQQVIDGSQWISRAASNISIDLFELRSAFIKHTATEHKDFQLLEKNYQALGESLEDIQSSPKNLGSIALSSFMFQQASQPNPIDLLGSMFIIEGIGKRLAGYWGEMIKDQLNLDENQVSFFTYHGVADENHFHRLEEALNHPLMHMELAQKIAQTAKITARLYHMQLEELGNY
ncbi:iron-containing redox enzyme family protein [Aureibacter tunicatorum]|uniref:3-oxoacyl-[acyl-carrier-protein] synthase-3 n=1 Tax=Aureibacter tunicatorum TaxID=866807 RepID=A0AAE3XLK5_9BACT|nr:iron-containing redox enzyme family protein [Aureibacter tunicatorum]MDR6237184.1 3-oxoacyl-[acyl-carrier-protein] synthase-3 [Aureibacter tunicatorum]BDD06176.1 hypothetical protein AUTU_36590 [Aureibacter tunicatorum]